MAPIVIAVESFHVRVTFAAVATTPSLPASPGPDVHAPITTGAVA